eukprot:TRINITY_DN2220_c1_g6_i1.p1 TRINITY_DN2220_c1_g6~~TRINITY_DN2220_c1_g6_i1.p1  ORF type:complete len:228 (-),score=38.70 TRINITY_DN2220_c1_g6_i1:19-702(-)
MEIYRMLILFTLITVAYSFSFFPPSVSHVNADATGELAYTGLDIPFTGKVHYLLNGTASNTHTLINIDLGQIIVVNQWSFVQQDGTWTVYYMVSDLVNCSHTTISPSSPDYPVCDDWAVKANPYCGSENWVINCKFQYPNPNSLLVLQQCLDSNAVVGAKALMTSGSDVVANATLTAKDTGVPPTPSDFALPPECIQNAVRPEEFRRMVQVKHGKRVAQLLDSLNLN